LYEILANPFQFADEAADDAEAFRPEGTVGGVDPERRQEFLVAQGAAGAQQGEVAPAKALTRPIIKALIDKRKAPEVGFGPSRLKLDHRAKRPDRKCLAGPMERDGEATAVSMAVARAGRTIQTYRGSVR
jgi:hypothetical protein